MDWDSAFLAGFWVILTQLAPVHNLEPDLLDSKPSSATHQQCSLEPVTGPRFACLWGGGGGREDDNSQCLMELLGGLIHSQALSTLPSACYILGAPKLWLLSAGRRRAYLVVGKAVVLLSVLGPDPGRVNTFSSRIRLAWP